MTEPMRDLGLDYYTAAHGIQSCIRYEQEKQDRLPESHFKHLRTGIDITKAEQRGFAELLMAKGVFTQDEYIEYMRLAVNEELARYEEHLRKTYNLPNTLSFR